MLIGSGTSKVIILGSLLLGTPTSQSSLRGTLQISDKIGVRYRKVAVCTAFLLIKSMFFSVKWIFVIVIFVPKFEPLHV